MFVLLEEEYKTGETETQLFLILTIRWIMEREPVSIEHEEIIKEQQRTKQKRTKKKTATCCAAHKLLGRGKDGCAACKTATGKLVNSPIH